MDCINIYVLIYYLFIYFVFLIDSIYYYFIVYLLFVVADSEYDDGVASVLCTQSSARLLSGHELHSLRVSSVSQHRRLFLVSFPCGIVTQNRSCLKNPMTFGMRWGNRDCKIPVGSGHGHSLC